MLTDIVNKIEQSKFHWTDVAIKIGIDKNDIFKIKRKNDSTLEFVHSVTQKIWDEIFHFVGLNLTDNDFTEISSIAKLAAILSGNIVKETHQEKHVKAGDTNDIENIRATDNENKIPENQTEVITSNNNRENIQRISIEKETPEDRTEATNNDVANIRANKIGSKTNKNEAKDNNYDQAKSYNASENIQAIDIEKKKTENQTEVVHEIVNRISQWRAFGRILNLKESFLNQLQTDCNLISDRNHKIIQKFSMPLTPNPSWMFWRQYLDEFDDGKLVIEEMEGAFTDLLPQIPNTITHIVTSDQLSYVGHPFQYRRNKDFLPLDKDNKLVCVQVGTKQHKFAHYQEFSEWIETQKHYMDTYNMFKDLKAINFVEDKACPILQTLENYLDAESNSGFAMKGYNFVNHFCLFKQGVFAKDVFNDSYFCFLANDNVVLYLTKCSKGPCHALHHSLRNVQIANVLHSELQSNNITQINIIIYNETNDSTQFCKHCIDNDLFVNEETFANVENFILWYKKFIANNNIQNNINQLKDLSMTGNEICNVIKKDMITYQALETSNLPSFSYSPEDQIDELTKLVILSPNQFKALHSNKKHILLRGSYGSGKSLVLFKKFELIVNNMTDSEIVYLICNDQQSAFIKYMKILRSKYHTKNIIICRSDQLTTGSKIIPKLSYILNHIKHVWKDKTVHVLIDEFSGSYFDNSEIEKFKVTLQNFQSSYIVIALQSMEQNIVEIENKSFGVSDFGYQFSKLTKETSFTFFNLDYSLRNSREINEFVKATAEILESSRVFVVEKQSFLYLNRIVDIEHGMEHFKDYSCGSEVMYKYNQNESIGHTVKSGLVNVYHCSSKDLDKARELFIVYLSTLEYILKDVTKVNKYVICTYDENLYEAIYNFLKSSLLAWTKEITEFMKTNSIFTVLLTDYAAVRGYEFRNVIFLSPLKKRYLKYRMLECFTRCTTKLHIISDELSVKDDSMEHQLIVKWKELNCVYFVDCSYEKSADKVLLVHNDTEIQCKENAKEIYSKPTCIYQMYPWWNHTSKIENVNQNVSSKHDDISIGLRCVVSMDNVRLFNDFINLHIDIYTYLSIHDKNLLHIASEYDAFGLSKILINDYKIDVNSTDKNKKTPLHLAASYGSSNIMNILLKNGAEVNVKDDTYNTPLNISSYELYSNIVQLLLDNGADVNIKNEDGDTPLGRCSYSSCINIYQLLLNNGADVNVKNSKGDTPLHIISSYEGHISIVQLLLDNGADINVKNSKGDTPLHISSAKDHTNIVQLLLNNGADVNGKNDFGRTAIDEAGQRNHHDIVELLKPYK